MATLNAKKTHTRAVLPSETTSMAHLVRKQNRARGVKEGEKESTDRTWR